MGDIRIHEKPNAVPNNAAVFAIEMQQNGVWYTRKVTWEQLTGLIAALNNLQNYYLKTETYTKTEVNQLIAAIPTFTIEIVEELPTTDISTSTLYLVPKTTAGTLDYYDEYINLDGTTSGWEYVGKTEVDLSNYYTKAETEAYVQGDGGQYIAATKTFSSLTTTAKTILGAINEAAGAASTAQADATQAISDAATAQGTANSASSAASAAQGTADNALTAAGNAANAASAAQGTANTALTTAQSMAVSVTNTLTPGDTTKKVADVTQNSTTTPIYADDAEKVIVALTDEQTTAPGNPVTLTTEQSGGAKSALVTFAPKQSGTGDPSPSNIRPISGWDRLNLTGTGKNLIDIADRTITSQYISKYFTLKKGTNTVSLFIKNNTTITGSFYLRKKDNTNAVYIGIRANMDSKQSASFTLDEDTDLRIVVSGTSSGYNYDISQVQIELGSTATAYEPYNGQTYTATFQNTVYGGSYDFVRGEGDGIFGIVDMGDLNWAYGNNVFNVTISDKANTYLMLCSTYKPTNKSRGELENGELGIYSTGALNRIAIRDDNYTTAADFKSAVTGQKLCYELATPTPITLTPADVNLLKGSNTVWTDGDTVQIKYSELPNGNLGAVIEYIKQLEARVKALES